MYSFPRQCRDLESQNSDTCMPMFTVASTWLPEISAFENLLLFHHSSTNISNPSSMWIQSIYHAIHAKPNYTAVSLPLSTSPHWRQ